MSLTMRKQCARKVFAKTFLFFKALKANRCKKREMTPANSGQPADNSEITLKLGRRSKISGLGTYNTLGILTVRLSSNPRIRTTYNHLLHFHHHPRNGLALNEAEMSSSTALKIFGFLVPVITVLLGLGQTGFWPSQWLHNALSGNVESSTPKT